MEENKTIKLKSLVDGKSIEILQKAIERSEILKGMAQDYPDSSELEVKSVSSDDLLKIKEYLEHYIKEEPKEVERPLRSKDFKECVNEFDYQFISKLENYDKLKSLILSANFLNIKPLINLAFNDFGGSISPISNKLSFNSINFSSILTLSDLLLNKYFIKSDLDLFSGIFETI